MEVIFTEKLSYLGCAWLMICCSITLEGAPAGSGSGSLMAEDLVYVDEQKEEYCPKYKPGDPAPASIFEECKTGSKIGVVDHMYAFGMNSSLVQTPNWTECGIPRLPRENERVCYKTKIVRCDDGYHIYLKRRNLQTLQACCPNETDEVLNVTLGERFLRSPRYNCKKQFYNENGDFFQYRNNEFCLYNISMPECSSGRIVIDNKLHFTQKIERRQRYNICTDYLQLFPAKSTASKRYCDSELSRLNLEINATQFTAIFWTDTTFNKIGFNLRISCVNTAEII